MIKNKQGDAKLKAPASRKSRTLVYRPTQRNKILREQIALWRETPTFISKPSRGNVRQPELISFRNLVPEITDTTYLTHALYYYPAKFIPQVVRYCLTEYSRENSWVVDPFAGSATVGLEAMLCRRNAILLDLNPLLNHIVPLKMTIKQAELNKFDLAHSLDALRLSTIRFYPDWSNLAYWYPPEILDVLCRYWGWQKQMPPSTYALIIEAALVKVSKQFSYAEHKAPKLFKSKTKLAEMETKLGEDWKAQLDETLYSTAFDICARVQQIAPLIATSQNQVVAYGGVDSSNFDFAVEDELDCVITSPPYLQAQEYIRTAKLDLYWLGHSEEEIKRLGKLEIPYRKANQIIETPTINSVKARLERVDLSNLLDSYFCFTLRALENAMKKLRKGGRACIFVGNPKVDGIEVETWRIVSEYFLDRGFAFEHVFEDRIKNRQLFGGRKNKNPDGMKSEFLLVLTK
jgi:DNA modification methylase